MENKEKHEIEKQFEELEELTKEQYPDLLNKDEIIQRYQPTLESIRLLNSLMPTENWTTTFSNTSSGVVNAILG